jgi:hypothetical protein
MKHLPNKKLITITTRTTLSDQHMKSFNELNMNHYLHLNIDPADCNSLTICINSLMKLNTLDNGEMSDYVLYIDEVTSFLELTHNKTLDNRIVEVFNMVMRFVKHADKVIVSDALITDGAFECLKQRSPNGFLYLENTFKKYQDVPAVRLRDENEFKQKLIDNCLKDDYFLFGCDSKKTVSTFYHECKRACKEAGLLDESKFLLITDDFKDQIKDANELFRNKFVFYSPKITFGLDFSIQEQQDVFIYIKGKSLQPSGIFQQTTRCRNIRNLYYYGEVAEQPAIYTSLEHVKEEVRHCVRINDEFSRVCTYLDENDELKVVENTFFNLFCHNQYVIDIYNTNKVKHYELILGQNGFAMSSTGTPKRIDTNEKKDMTTVVTQIDEATFKAYIADEDKSKKEYQSIRNNIGYLKLPHDKKEVLEPYMCIIIDKYEIEEHDNIIKLLKTDDFIHKR